MTQDELNKKYFEWMYQLVCNDGYRKLLTRLHNIDFNYIIGLDANRVEDGVDLRYRFGYENSYEDVVIAAYLDCRPCSVLEMLIALAIRCEEHIMTDVDIGDRTGQWFWSMVENLGLGYMCDAKFDSRYVDGVISRFMNRQHKRNGEGGLFTIKHCEYDLRSVEIWYQMCWSLANETWKNV